MRNTEVPPGEEDWVADFKEDSLIQQGEREAQEEKERRLEAMALEDEATGLWNLRGLKKTGAALLADRAREHAPAAVMMLDLNDMKGLNTRFGHPAVNTLLKKFADHLMAEARPKDVVARYGGDEFVIVFAAPAEDALKRFLAPFETELDDGTPVTMTFTGHTIDVHFDAKEGPHKIDFQKKLMDTIGEANGVMMEKKQQAKSQLAAQ